MARLEHGVVGLLGGLPRPVLLARLLVERALGQRAPELVVVAALVQRRHGRLAREGHAGDAWAAPAHAPQLRTLEPAGSRQHVVGEHGERRHGVLMGYHQVEQLHALVHVLGVREVRERVRRLRDEALHRIGLAGADGLAHGAPVLRTRGVLAQEIGMMEHAALGIGNHLIAGP